MTINDFLPAAAPVARLIQEFNKLPGIGSKSAQRLTYYLVRMPEEEAKALAEALLAVKDKIIFCSLC
ncbi:MAG: recombination protein RecR, partial [Chloroflexi bacterium]|nr:recombination protein RecR [Chloroflexota bacterium]